MRCFRDLPLKTKLTLLMMATSAIALLLGAVAGGGYGLYRFRAGLAAEMQTLAGVVAANSTAALLFHDASAAHEILAALQTRPEIVSACLYTPDGRPFAMYERGDPTQAHWPPSPRADGYEFSHSRLALFKSIMQGHELVGTIYLQSDLQEQYSRLRAYVIMLVTLMLVSLCLAMAFASGLMRVVSDPILDLAGVARGVTEKKDYSLRAQKRSEDEMGLLVQTFNEMLSEIQHRDTALQSQTTILQSILNSMGDGVIVADERGQFLLFNPAAERIGGVPLRGETHEEWARRCALSLADAETPCPTERLPLLRAIRGEAVDGMELFLRPPNASEGVWVSATARPLRDEKGAVRGGVVVFRDISEQKRAERQLRTSEQRFRQIAESINEVFWMTNLDKTEIIYVSPAYEHVWGRTCESLYAQPRTWLDAVHPQDRERVMRAALTCQVNGQYNEEYRVVRPDGSVRWVRDRAFPIRDDAGTVYRIAGIAADVTELKSAEETLRESEQRFRSAFDHASTGMALCALDGRWLKVNRSLCNIVGYNEQELLATDFQSITYPDDLAADMEGMRQLLAGESQSYQLEKRYFHKQGHIVWILLSGSLVRDAWGEPLYFIAQMQDITERKRLEKQILEISDREQQRIGQDLHDGLCQHLTGTALATKVLEDKLAAQLVAEAAEAREIAALINEAISQARSISRGLYPVGLEAEGLMAALQEMAAGVEEVWRIPCVVECNPPVLVHDHAVALQLYRIAQEAVNNALKHAQARQIVVHLCVENGRITLSVQDDGVGIPRNLRSKKGMGLHIMAYRARVIAASFEVSAGPDGGTTVTCRLPQQKSAAQRPES